LKFQIKWRTSLLCRFAVNRGFFPESLNIRADAILRGRFSLSLKKSPLSLASIFDGDLIISIQNSEIKDIPFAMSAHLNYDNSIVSIDSATFSYRDYKFENISISYTTQNKNIKCKFDAKVPLLGKLLSATIMVNGENIDSAMLKGGDSTDVAIYGSIVNARLDSSTIDPLDFLFSSKGDAISLEFRGAEGKTIAAKIYNLSDFEVSN